MEVRGRYGVRLGFQNRGEMMAIKPDNLRRPVMPPDAPRTIRTPVTIDEIDRALATGQYREGQALARRGDVDVSGMRLLPASIHTLPPR